MGFSGILWDLGRFQTGSGGVSRAIRDIFEEFREVQEGILGEFRGIWKVPTGILGFPRGILGFSEGFSRVLKDLGEIQGGIQGVSEGFSGVLRGFREFQEGI